MSKLIGSVVAVLTCFTITGAYAAAEDDFSIETALNDTEATHLVFMREEEKLARDTYITLYETWGSKVFSNISNSEQTHMDKLGDLLSVYAIEDPIVDDTVGSFTNTTLADLYVDLVARGKASLLEALHVGALIEEIDIHDIEEAIDETIQPDIIIAYENLLAGSGNHLRAFVNQIELRGVGYVAQFLEQSEVDSILGISSGGAFRINAGLNDAWYDPETSGQGFFITVFPDLELISLAWFTFDTELPAEGVEAILGDAGHRWLTALGQISGTGSVMNIEISSGGIFDTATEVTHVEDGTITLTFTDCNRGTVEYDIPSIGRSGSVPIQRVAADNIALCEALNED